LYNENIKIGGQSITKKECIQNEVYLVSQLYNQDSYMTYIQFKTKYPRMKINFLLYNGIINTIQRYERKLSLDTKGNRTVKFQPHIQRILSQTKGTKNIYQALIIHPTGIKGITTWKNRFRIDFEQNALFQKIKITTTDTKLKWLQYRILHNILTTNKSVAKYKREQDERCSFCTIHPESIEHLFWNCDIITTFWNKLNEKIINTCTQQNNLKLTKKLIILGIDENVETDGILDLIILLAKQYIYHSKVIKNVPNIRHFQRILKRRYTIEKEINFKEQQTKTLQNKWNPYMNLINQ